MTRYSLPAPQDRNPFRWSSRLGVVALVLALAAVAGPAPFNGVSLLAVVAAILSIVLRLVEVHSRTSAAHQKGTE